MLRTFAMLVLLAAGSGCVNLAKLEHSIVYQPTRLDPPPPGKPKPPTKQEFVEAKIPLESMLKDCNSLSGLFAEAKDPRAVVLYCHGNGGNVEDCVETLRLFRDCLNVSILAFDYRGYGSSANREISEKTMYKDARLARAWLAKRAGVAETDIVLVGRSLGGGVAVELAASDGARGLILENTFTSIPDVAASVVPLLPICWLLESRYDSLSKIGKYHGLLLQTHGEADRVIPYKLGKKLFAAANEPKEFVRVWGGDHNDPPSPEYLAALRRFVDSLPAD